MIGKLCTILTPYYDIHQQQMQIKARPALVIGKADESDLTLLPVSRVSDRRRIHPEFDLMIDPAIYSEANLRVTSYIRTHKVFTADSKDIGNVFADLKTSYPDLFAQAVRLFKTYTDHLVENS